jgi:hypothetical protein
MAGLVPAIHALKHLNAEKTWMPATSAGMTSLAYSAAAASRASYGNGLSCTGPSPAMM